jgi:hypothetical protein
MKPFFVMIQIHDMKWNFHGSFGDVDENDNMYETRARWMNMMTT